MMLLANHGLFSPSRVELARVLMTESPLESVAELWVAWLTCWRRLPLELRRRRLGPDALYGCDYLFVLPRGVIPGLGPAPGDGRVHVEERFRLAAFRSPDQADQA